MASVCEIICCVGRSDGKGVTIIDFLGKWTTDSVNTEYIIFVSVLLWQSLMQHVNVLYLEWCC